MKKICIALTLALCMSATLVSAASYDMSKDKNYFEITTISNPSDVYVDGVLVAENVTEIPKSLVTLGTHNVKIVEGETEVYNQNVDVVNSVYGISKDYDFSDYTSGTYTVDDFKVFSEGAEGFASSVTVDEKHGKSFGIVYRDSATSSSWAQNYLLYSVPNDTSNSLHYEYEVFSTVQKKDRNMYMVTTASGKSKNINMLNFGASQTIRVYSNDKKLEDITRDDSGVWYKISVDVTVNSAGGGTYDLNIYKDSANGFALEKAYTDLVLPTTVTALNAFRFIGPYDTDATDAYLAVDNISYSYKYQTPIILTVNGVKFNSVNFGTNNISIKLSSGFDAEMFTKDNVSVEDMKIESAQVVDDTVEIVLEDKLSSNTEYEIKFSENTVCSFGGKLGYPLTCKIRTLKNAIEIHNVNYDNGKLTADVENTTDTPKTVYAIVTYFNGYVIQKTSVVEVTPSVGLDTLLVLPDGCTDFTVTFIENYMLPVVYKSVNIDL